MGSERLWEIVISALSGGGLIALGWKALEYLRAWWRTTIGDHASVQVQRIKAADRSEERLYERIGKLEELYTQAQQQLAEIRAELRIQHRENDRLKKQITAREDTIEQQREKIDEMAATIEKLRRA